VLPFCEEFVIDGSDNQESIKYLVINKKGIAVTILENQRDSFSTATDSFFYHCKLRVRYWKISMHFFFQRHLAKFSTRNLKKR